MPELVKPFEGSVYRCAKCFPLLCKGDQRRAEAEQRERSSAGPPDKLCVQPQRPQPSHPLLPCQGGFCHPNPSSPGSGCHLPSASIPSSSHSYPSHARFAALLPNSLRFSMFSQAISPWGGGGWDRGREKKKLQLVLILLGKGRGELPGFGGPGQPRNAGTRRERGGRGGRPGGRTARP